MAKFYSDEDRQKILNEIANENNSRVGITEATGLRILDGIYILIEMLHRFIPMEHDE